MARRRYDSTGQNVDSTVGELNRLLAASREVRRPFEGQWILNDAMYAGNQWLEFDGRQLFEPELEGWRAKIVDNRILPSVRREVARMTKAKPVWVGVPKDSSDDEIAAARMRERAFEHYWRLLHAGRKLRTSLRWSRVAAAGFWKITWDGSKGSGREILFNAQGEKLLDDETGGPLSADRIGELGAAAEQLGITARRIAMGDVVLETRTPFEIFPDPLAGEDGLIEAEWVIEEAIHSENEVRRLFPDVDADKIIADAAATAGVAQSRMSRAIGAREAQQYKGVRLREFWALPSSEFENGRRCVWTGSGTILLEEDNPYPWLPYVMFGGIPVPGRFWPTSVTEQEISPSVQRNKTLSQVSENAERIGNPPRLKPASYDGDEWLGLPGEEIEYDDSQGEESIPRFMDVPNLPQHLFTLLELMNESMREVSSQHEVSAAQVPSGVTAASAINLLLEQDHDILGPDIDDMADSLLEAGRRVLWLLRRYASDERLAKIAGEEGTHDIFSFRGTDLGDCDDDGVQIGSGAPQSKAAKQAALQETLAMLAQSGVPLDERSLRRVLQEYEVGGLEQFFATVGRDERQVQAENQQLVRGEELGINEFDNDAAHIAGHTDFQKTARWGELDEETQATFEAHVQLHRDRMEAKVTEIAGPPPGGPNGGDPAAALNGGPSGVVPSQP